MKKISLFLLAISLLLNSCSKDEIETDSGNLLPGVWNYSGYVDNTVVYKRGEEFTDNPGYKFKSDGTLVLRQNSGWCGTPPIFYADYDGTWSIINDTLISVKSAYWGGITTFRLDIESLSANTLKVILLPEPE